MLHILKHKILLSTLPGPKFTDGKPQAVKSKRWMSLSAITQLLSLPSCVSSTALYQHRAFFTLWLLDGTPKMSHTFLVLAVELMTGNSALHGVDKGQGQEQHQLWTILRLSAWTQLMPPGTHLWQHQRSKRKNRSADSRFWTQGNMATSDTKRHRPPWTPIRTLLYMQPSECV